MYNRLQTFLEKTNSFQITPSNFPISFRQKHSCTHVLVHLTERNRTQLDNGNYGCGIFVDSQNNFDTLDLNVFPKNKNGLHIIIVI